jgi:tight adherence protein C
MGTSKAERQAKIVKLLLEAIDSLIASLESGFGLDHGMYQYAQEADNELSRAFEDVLQEIQSGVRRRDAVRNMAQRIDVSEVATFVNAVIQADEQGLSILETLKSQAEQLRRWQQSA